MSDERYKPITEALSRRWGGDWRFPGMPEQLWRAANEAWEALQKDHTEALTMLATHVCPYHDLTEATARAERAESQLQQAETALRRVEDIARPGCAGVHGYEFSAIVREVHAALSAPPADPPKEP